MVKRAVVNKRQKKKSPRKKRKLGRRSKRKREKFKNQSLSRRVSPDSTSAPVDVAGPVLEQSKSEMDDSSALDASNAENESVVSQVREDPVTGSRLEGEGSEVDASTESNVENNGVCEGVEADSSIVSVHDASNGEVITVDESVICLDNTASSQLDSSVFIIDVEPSQCAEVNLLLNFANNNALMDRGGSEATRRGHREQDLSNDPDRPADPPGSPPDSDLNKSRVHVSSDASLSDGGFQRLINSGELSDLDPNSNQGSGDRSDASGCSAKAAYLPAFAAINNIVEEMKKDGFLNRSSVKRKFRDDAFGQNKRSRTSRESPAGNWNLYKRVKGIVSAPDDPRSTATSPDNPEGKTTLSNDHPDSDEMYIPVEDDTDSDVEFVQAFNPQDRTIELSDSEDSVIIDDSSPPFVIALPPGKAARKKRPNSNNTGPVTSTTPETSRVKKKKKRAKKKESPPPKPDPATLRPIVIDGCNVAMGHSRSRTLSVAGLKICYDYFKDRGHSVKIFLPQSKKYHPMTSDTALLDKMEKEGVVVFTPSRRVDGKLIGSYDDRFILEYATLKGAIVVTRDNYRDLYSEREDFRDTIKNRLLQYTFIDDLIMFPQDPLGRTGPNLSEFLKFTHKQQIPKESSK